MEALKCSVKDSELRGIIAKRATAKGCRRAGQFGAPGPIYFNTHDCHVNGYVTTNEYYADKYREVSVEEFLKAVDSFVPQPPPPPPITVAGYDVQFRPNGYDGIKVGCTEIPTATVDEIHKRLHEKQ